MDLFEIEPAPTAVDRAPVLLSELDFVLTAQLVVAWAGEGCEEPRLAWWRSDLVSEYGGEDLFARLLPHTWQWAVLQGAREAARRTDAQLRGRDHNPDRILSLFYLGFELDEALEERFQDLKRSGQLPQEALPGLAGVIDAGWDQELFLDWLVGHDDTKTTSTSIGRRIAGDLPSSLERQVRRLVSGLVPLAEAYPLPHYRREK